MQVRVERVFNVDGIFFFEVLYMEFKDGGSRGDYIHSRPVGDAVESF